jgi:secreted trypsin-like serine protease
VRLAKGAARTRQRAAYVFCLFTVAACGGVEELEGSSDDAIVGGRVVDFAIAPPEYASVVQVLVRSSLCTGTVIDPEKRVVLTAAHCVVRGRDQRQHTVPPGDIQVYAARDANSLDDDFALFNSRLYAVVEVRAHSGYDNRTVKNDIALIRLAAPIRDPLVTSTPPLPPERGFRRGDVGDLALDFVGWGDDENDTTGILRHAQSVLGGIGCGRVRGCSGADPAIQIAYSQNRRRAGLGPCSGDSGGPAFIHRRGTTYVAAVTSFGDAQCTRWGVSTRVDAFPNFIRRFLNGG